MASDTALELLTDIALFAVLRCGSAVECVSIVAG